MPNTAVYNWVTQFGQIEIVITQVSQDTVNLTSQVRVDGFIINWSGREISASGVSSNITGDQNFDGGNFSFDLPDGNGGQKKFITHTFTVQHGPNGFKTSHFTVKYGVTGTGPFGDNKSVSASLDLDRIPVPPDKMDFISYNQVGITTINCSWTAPNNGGSTIKSYRLTIKDNLSQIVSGGTITLVGDTVRVIDTGNNDRTRLLTDLNPRTEYAVFIKAQNDSDINNGFGDDQLNPPRVTTLSGAKIRVGGVWKDAAPWIRVGGQWVPAVPYCRRQGNWDLTG